MISIDYNIITFREGDAYIAYCPKLDLSSCGDTVDQARDMLKTAVKLFIEEAEKMNTLEIILEEAGYEKDPDGRWIAPEMISAEMVRT